MCNNIGLNLGLIPILTQKVREACVHYESMSMYIGRIEDVNSVAFKIFGRDITKNYSNTAFPRNKGGALSQTGR